MKVPEITRLLRPMLSKFVHYIWAILWGVLMLTLMGLPSDDMPSVSFFNGFDKMAHCGFFFVFTNLLLVGATQAGKKRPSKFRPIFIALFIASLFAFGTEGLQMAMAAGRHPDWWDIFADYTGVGMALFGYLLFYRKPSLALS